MINYSITNKSINERYSDGYESVQQAVWYLVSHTSKADRWDNLYQVWHYDDNYNVIVDWESR